MRTMGFPHFGAWIKWRLLELREEWVRRLRGHRTVIGEVSAAKAFPIPGWVLAAGLAMAAFAGPAPAQVTADLSIAVTDSPDPVLFGNTLTYTVTVTNLGPGNADGVRVRQSLPRDMIFVSSTPSQGICSGVIRDGLDTVVLCILAMSNGASATITTLIIPTSGPVNFNNFTVFDPFVTDPNPANNSASANTTMVAGASLTILKAGTGSGTLTSSPAGINCSVDCFEVYNFGTSVTLTPNAAADSVFAGWSAGGCTGLGSCTVAMNVATSVTATFNLVPPTFTRADFNADGRSDILWHNAMSGENYLYPMDGTTILGTEGYLRTVADLNWKVAGIGDFDGDGKADIIWRNIGTGENYIYLMIGTTIDGEGYLRTVTDQNWQVAGVGDFDGDGKDDILWRNSLSGENYLYPMDGLTIKPTEGYLRTVADLSWGIVGVGDFDADGKADVLWRNSSTGQNYLYPMDGTTIKPTEGYLRTVAEQAWQVKGVGDFDGDGKADIVWSNSANGQNYLYPMDGTTIKPTEGYLRTVADTTWQIVAVGDYDGDGKADILWRNSSSGQNYLYPMDGTTIQPTEGYLRTVPQPNWQVQNQR